MKRLKGDIGATNLLFVPQRGAGALVLLPFQSEVVQLRVRLRFLEVSFLKRRR